jgi:hypothetical protein
LKKFFVLPALPSNEKNSFDHHNSYNKGPNLAFFSFTEALLIPYLHKKIQKINIHHHLKPSCPKQQWPKFGHCGPLGVKIYKL